MPYYFKMESFTEEQAAKIKSEMKIPEGIEIRLISLTQSYDIRDDALALIFTTPQSEWEKFDGNFLQSWREMSSSHPNFEPKSILFNDIQYSLSKAGEGGRGSKLYQYLPVKEGAGAVLYYYGCVEYNIALSDMVKKFGKQVDDFTRLKQSET